VDAMLLTCHIEVTVQLRQLQQCDERLLHCASKKHVNFEML